MPAAPTTTLSYADGDFADPNGTKARSIARTVLVGAQWLVLVFRFLAWITLKPPRRVRAWVGTIAAIVGLAVVELLSR